MNFFKYLKTVSLAAALCAAINANAQKLGDIAKMDNSYLMLVNEMKTPEQNDLYNQNLNTMRLYAGKLKELEKRIGEEKDAAKKEELQKKFTALENEFKANDEVMRKQYAFASNRQYRMLFLSSNICTVLSKEELSSLKSDDGKPLDPMKIIQKNGVNYYRLKSIEGIPANLELQKNLNVTLAQKANVENLRKQIAETLDATQQMKLTKELSQLEIAMKKQDAKMREAYGIGDKKNFIVEIGHSQTWLALTPQELTLIQQQQAANKK